MVVILPFDLSRHSYSDISNIALASAAIIAEIVCLCISIFLALPN